ncbi:SPOR domain-containing protein [Rhodoferax sp. OV413]|uniref:SPOR domain-containing protein n=1 Tax=Rhodoferax sp. OV413 TaxID=1855285 RepID=UPI0025DEE309|nr:SPOR domain-containing protein [Rhodoferax sp. OV413]
MKSERGGTLVGFIIGVVVGLGAALAVAVYVTKVPVPFMNKSQSRSADQDAAEAQKNKNWDPNAPMYGKNPAPAVPVATVPGAPAKDNKPDGKVADKATDKAADKASADPLGDLVRAKAGGADTDTFTYWVQVGSFRTAEDAETQRAKLSLSGIETKISERELAGKPVFRVRVGPFDHKEDADKAKEKMDKAGLETALVRVQRQTQP